jgi:hypothetical protein
VLQAEKFGTLKYEKFLLHYVRRIFIYVGLVVNPKEIATSSNTVHCSLFSLLNFTTMLQLHNISFLHSQISILQEWATSREQLIQMATFIEKTKEESQYPSIEDVTDLSLVSLICYYQNKRGSLTITKIEFEVFSLGSFRQHHNFFLLLFVQKNNQRIITDFVCVTQRMH